jgi:hypothetical protein
MKRLLILLGLIAAIAAPAAAQQLPYAWPQTVGTTAVQVLPANPARKQVFFHNPNASATVSVCPTVSRKDGTNVACTVNGAGSITLLPGGSATLGGVGSPTAAIPTPWNGIASAPSTPLTIYEWE